MSDIVDEILAHHGIKGMKWGVRRDKGHEGQRAKTTKIARLDKKFERQATSFDTTVKIHNGAIKKANDEVARINNKPQYKNADLTRDTPLRRKYYKEHQDSFINALEASANSLGTNASGTKKYGIIDKGDSWDIVLRDVKHDVSSDPVEFKVTLNKDERGHILSFEMLEEMAHTDELVADFLEHFGIKGMKWGVRRRDPSIPASEDHQRLATVKQKSKAGGTKSLSNKEIQDYLARLNLERQFNQTKPSGMAGKFISDLLLGVGKQQITKVASDAAGKQVGGLLKNAK